MKNKPTKIIIEKVMKEIHELEGKILLKRVFLMRLCAGKVKVKKSKYKDTDWYYESKDELTEERAYAFRKRK